MRGFYDSKISATAAQLVEEDSKNSTDNLPYTIKTVKGNPEEDKQRDGIRKNN